ncbi:MAG: (2Fe-2S)-binding protein [Rhodospirillales bacterium]|nr:(2Fe-2S)-binding protein [Rhodospirillales bacterium]
MQAKHVVLSVNGKQCSVAVDPGTPLLYVIRNELDLKATRIGCGEGNCFSCTLLVDGRPQQSCSLTAAEVEGKSIETIEAIRDTELGQSLIASFIAEQAGQCGYCLAGILVSAKALLERQPSPSRNQIIAAIDGHLCRCGAHTRIIRAIEKVAFAQRMAG